MQILEILIQEAWERDLEFSFSKHILYIFLQTSVVGVFVLYINLGDISSFSISLGKPDRSQNTCLIANKWFAHFSINYPILLS